MSDLAQRIREARAAKGLSVEDAERTLKIRAKYLKAIEAGDYAQLPDGPASRGFVKNYARLLGISADDALGAFEAEVGVPIIQLQEDIPPPPERKRQESEYTKVALPELRWKGKLPDEDEIALDQLADADEVDARVEMPMVGKLDGTTGRAVVIRPSRSLHAVGSSFRLKRLSTHADSYDDFDANMISGRAAVRRSINLPINADVLQKYLPTIGVGLAAIAALALVWLVLLPLVQTGFAAITARIAQPNTTSTSEQYFQPTILVPIVTPQSEATEPPKSDASRPTEEMIPVSPLPGGGLSLALDARERAWVRVKVDGNVVFEGIPQIGPNVPWTAKQSVFIETGNAGAFDVIVNGSRSGSAGARNETIQKTFQTQ